MAAAAKVSPTPQDRRDTARRFYTTEPGSFVHIPKPELNRFALVLSAAALLGGAGFLLLELAGGCGGWLGSAACCAPPGWRPGNC